MLNGHCGIDHWEIILIDKGRDKQDTRKKSVIRNGKIVWKHGSYLAQF